MTIAEQNDNARRALGVGCRLVQTPGISALHPMMQSAIRERVERFDDWTEDNDPHGEHDFGSFIFSGHKVFWKIDYYDLNYQYGSEEPADPEQTRRVLTIMLAEEY